MFHVYFNKIKTKRSQIVSSWKEEGVSWNDDLLWQGKGVGLLDWWWHNIVLGYKYTKVFALVGLQTSYTNTLNEYNVYIQNQNRIWEDNLLVRIKINNYQTAQINLRKANQQL